MGAAANTAYCTVFCCCSVAACMEITKNSDGEDDSLYLDGVDLILYQTVYSESIIVLVYFPNGLLLLV